MLRKPGYPVVPDPDPAYQPPARQKLCVLRRDRRTDAKGYSDSLPLPHLSGRINPQAADYRQLLAYNAMAQLKGQDYNGQ